MTVCAKCVDCKTLNAKQGKMRCNPCYNDYLEVKSSYANDLYLKALAKLNRMNEKQLKNFIRR